MKNLDSQSNTQIVKNKRKMDGMTLASLRVRFVVYKIAKSTVFYSLMCARVCVCFVVFSWANESVVGKQTTHWISLYPSQFPLSVPMLFSDDKVDNNLRIWTLPKQKRFATGSVFIIWLCSTSLMPKSVYFFCVVFHISFVSLCIDNNCCFEHMPSIEIWIWVSLSLALFISRTLFLILPSLYLEMLVFHRTEWFETAYIKDTYPTTTTRMYNLQWNRIVCVRALTK